MNHSVVGAATQLITSSAARRAPLTPDPFVIDGTTRSPAEYAAALSRAAAAPVAPASVYVHLPFCPSRCLSCDHSSVVTHEPAVIDAYLDSLALEFRLVAEGLGKRRQVAQLHVGGGTPNYLSVPQLVRLATMIDAHFDLTPDAEVSLEANPSRATPGQLELLAGIGFNTIHFELRDLDPAVQRAIGRAHSPAMLKDVFANAREAGIRTIGMDLLYGLPGQTLTSMRNTVTAALALQPDRIACYPFSRRVEAFPHQRAIDPSDIPSLADKLALLDAIATGFEGARFTWVGLDCFVRPGDPLAIAQSEGRLRRNRIGYTLHETAELLGFGMAAVSEVDGLLVQNHPDLARWQGALASGELPLRAGARLADTRRRQRDAMAHLMSNMTLRDHHSLRGVEALAEYERNGLVRVTDDGISVTPQGRLVLHHILSDSSPRHRWDGIWQLPMTG